MRREDEEARAPEAREVDATVARAIGGEVPRPTPQFRRRAWLTFQRALDPLSPPKPLRPRRH